ncbi:MAG: metalloregulator ArsR/SmtB family transcription factor [Myxococcota bacterium]|nr:metalloregulator ArsR/SmtB family transcription factor [Myxococcota bacterium]
MMPKSALHERLSVLSDPTRLRLLRVLETEELGVGELGRVLLLAQSTVSRHLKVLHEGGWVARRSEGTANYFRLAVDALGDDAARLWRLVREQAGDGEPYVSDQRRAQALVAIREADARAFFARHAGRWDGLRRDLFGDGFLLPTLLALLPERMVIADLGCGTGAVVEALAPSVRHAIGVDREPAMIEAAGRRTAGLHNVTLHAGTLDALPLQDGCLDAATLMLVLHHVPDLDAVFREVARALRPRGRIVLLDMQAHDRAEYRHTMGHEHLGFEQAVLARTAAAAGLQVASWRPLPVAPDALAPPLFVAVLRKAHSPNA